MAAERPIILNLPPARAAVRRARRAKKRVSLEIVTEPVVHDLGELGTGVADAIAKQIGEMLRRSGRKVSEATQRRRGPGGSTTYGYNTGVLARGIAARLVRAGEWTIGAPGDRVTPRNWSGTRESFQRWVANLREIIDMRKVMGSQPVQAAVKAGWGRAIRVGARARQGALLRRYGRVSGGRVRGEV